jgi:hypothetical protein
MKRSIVQKDNFGCGAACVAFVVGREYEEIARSLGKKQAQTRGFMCRELKAELEKHGFTYILKYVPKMQNQMYANGAIVFIKRSAEYPHGHYLASYEGRWMDPWINLSHESLRGAKSGFRERLPGQAQYALLPAKDAF